MTARSRWTDDLEATFKGRVAANCEFRWGEVWRIKSTSPVSGKISDIGVIFNVESVFFSLDAHYNVTVKGVRGRSPVSETVPGKGTAKWDSLDVNPNSIKKYKDQEFYQMGAVHEFGHMLGLYDEYYGSSDDPMPWQDDPGSMMHTGMGTRGITFRLPAGSIKTTRMPAHSRSMRMAQRSLVGRFAREIVETPGGSS